MDSFKLLGVSSITGKGKGNSAKSVVNEVALVFFCVASSEHVVVDTLSANNFLAVLCQLVTGTTTLTFPRVTIYNGICGMAEHVDKLICVTLEFL